MPGASHRKKTPESTLALVPRLAEGVEIAVNDEGFAEASVPYPRTRWMRFLRFIFKAPDVRILVLDEAGTFAAGLIDGRRTFGELSALLAEERGLEASEAQRSMAAFLRSLADRRMIVFGRPGDDGALEESVD